MLKIIDLAQSALWKTLWQNLPREQRSVYFMPEYYQLYEKMGHGVACCAVYEGEEGYLIYPFLKRSIEVLHENKNRSIFDIEGAVGLNGSAGVNLTGSDLTFFSDEWSAYCVRENIVAEFTRANPLFDSINRLQHLTQFIVSTVVSVNLLHDDFLYDSYEHSVRKSIKKAVKEGVVIEFYSSSDLPDTYLDHFASVYDKTMERNNAQAIYYYPKKYFEDVKTILGENAMWFFALSDKKVISVELVLFDECNCYSFLGGTLAWYLATGCNALLKHELICYFKKIGLVSYFLGGGHQKNDGIYKYKKSFSKSEDMNMLAGKKIHNEFEYASLVEDWCSRYPEKQDVYKNYFLKYRC